LARDLARRRAFSGSVAALGAGRRRTPTSLLRDEAAMAGHAPVLPEERERDRGVREREEPGEEGKEKERQGAARGRPGPGRCCFRSLLDRGTGGGNEAQRASGSRSMRGRAALEEEGCEEAGARRSSTPLDRTGRRRRSMAWLGEWIPMWKMRHGVAAAEKGWMGHLPKI